MKDELHVIMDDIHEDASWRNPLPAIEEYLARWARADEFGEQE